MVEHLCGEWQGAEVMREIEKVVMERRGSTSATSIGMETTREVFDAPTPVCADLEHEPCVLPLAPDVGMVTAQVA